jgi:hypothetical protein
VLSEIEKLVKRRSYEEQLKHNRRVSWAIVGVLALAVVALLVSTFLEWIP